jgi:hypothetical protein
MTYKGFEIRGLRTSYSFVIHFSPSGSKIKDKAEEINAKHGNTQELIAIPNP